MTDTPESELTSESRSSVRVPEKITLRLPPDARVALEWIAAKRNVTLAEVIRHAISTEKFLIDELDRGNNVLIEETSGRIKQLVIA